MFGVYFENLDGDLGLRSAENQIYLTEINNSVILTILLRSCNNNQYFSFKFLKV